MMRIIMARIIQQKFKIMKKVQDWRIYYVKYNSKEEMSVTIKITISNYQAK